MEVYYDLKRLDQLFQLYRCALEKSVKSSYGLPYSLFKNSLDVFLLVCDRSIFCMKKGNQL